mgnify:CR=1 FL=1
MHPPPACSISQNQSLWGPGWVSLDLVQIILPRLPLCTLFNAFKNFGPDILIDGKPVENYKNKNYSSIQKPLERIANGNATLADNEKIAEFNKRNKGKNPKWCNCKR